jgi:hypothetical protein
MGIGKDGSIVELQSKVKSKFAATTTSMKSFSQYCYDNPKHKKYTNLKSKRASYSKPKRSATQYLKSPTKPQRKYTKPTFANSPSLNAYRQNTSIHNHKVMSENLQSLVERESTLATRPNISINDRLTVESQMNKTGKFSHMIRENTMMSEGWQEDVLSNENNEITQGVADSNNLFLEDDKSEFSSRDKDDIQKAFNKLASIARRNLRQLTKVNSPSSKSLLSMYKGIEVLSGNKEIEVYAKGICNKPSSPISPERPKMNSFIRARKIKEITE